MTKQEFDKFQAALLNRGYKRHNQHWHREDYVLGISFYRDEEICDEGRSAYQILLSIYDHTLHPEYFDRIPEENQNLVGIEVHVDVSRTIDERMELHTSWDENTTIEEIESIADSFYRWVSTAYPIPRRP